MIPTHINLRARAHEAKKRVSDEELVPFGDMQDMKCKYSDLLSKVHRDEKCIISLLDTSDC